jgi:hypothetical protein
MGVKAEVLCPAAKGSEYKSCGCNTGIKPSEMTTIRPLRRIFYD